MPVLYSKTGNKVSVKAEQVEAMKNAGYSSKAPELKIPEKSEKKSTSDKT